MKKKTENRGKGVKQMRKGKFIVIEGIDGCGKKTQTALLVKRLRKDGYKVKTIDFPQYENNFFGKFIGECLAGKYGDFAKLDPKIASVLYGADRWESSQKINKWLEKGNIVIADRYASANQVHQGGKITDSRKRREFLKWLDEMEFGVFKIPRPSGIIYLNIPLRLSLQLLTNSDAKKRKAYLEGKKDAHESDPKHLLNAKRSALNLVKENNNWVDIKCAKNGDLLSIEEVHKMVWKQVQEILIN